MRTHAHASGRRGFEGICRRPSASLGSPGVSRLPRDYGCSDSWRVALRTQVSRRSRLPRGVTAHEHPPVPSRSPCFMRSNLPTIPSPTTLRRPCTMIWFSDHRAYRRDTPHRSSHRQAKASVGLRQWGAGSPRRLAESSSLPTDWSFTSCCSPPGLAATQLHSVTKFRPNFGKDFHLAGSIHLQAHTPTSWPRG